MSEASGAPTLRETYTLVNSLRSELLAEMRSIHSEIKAELVAHKTEHEKHDTEHQTEAKARASQLRWAVTTVMSGFGVLVAIYVAFSR